MSGGSGVTFCFTANAIRWPRERARSKRILRDGRRCAEGSRRQGGVSDRGANLHQPHFNTEDGKAHFAVTPIPMGEPGPGEFRLMTIRSEGQFNTVVYEDEDVYRGTSRRDVVMMSAEDAKSLGVTEGDRVVVRTDVGEMPALVSIAEIRPRNLAMYYPRGQRAGTT
jgi:anaerobic selenocysteine-containing dehydrogenase